MGFSYSFVCKTCKKDYYLGYGSYAHYCFPKDGVDTPETYKERVGENPTARVARTLECITEHQGHDWFTRDDENDDVRPNPEGGTDLWRCIATGIEDFYDKLVDRYDLYERVDLEERDEKRQEEEERRITARCRELYAADPAVMPASLAELINAEFGADSMDAGWAEGVLQSLRPKPELPKDLKRTLNNFEERQRRRALADSISREG